jgi:hypothetical protein
MSNWVAAHHKVVPASQKEKTSELTLYEYKVSLTYGVELCIGVRIAKTLDDGR